jgi:glycosyltransferase involved in cell wall biosynthesis
MVSAETTPLVSVVIPTYGRPDYLPEAVRCVAEQTHERVELVVVDDHSPEPIEPAVSDVDVDRLERAEVVRHEENRGANAARCTGISRSMGEFVAFLDDDDLWDSRYLERVVDRFEDGGSDVGVVLVGARVVDDDGERIGSVTPAADGRVTEAILRGTVQAGSFSRFVVRRSVLDAAGVPDDRLPSLQDKEWHIRLSTQCRYASVPDLLVTRRYTSHDQITDDYEAKRDVSVPLLLQEHRDLAAAYGRGTERRFVASLTRTLGFSALRNGSYRAALKHFLAALGRDPTDTTSYLYLLVALGGPMTYKPARHVRRAVRNSRT